MTIKQQGGIFGRNPTFNDVDVDNDISISGDATVTGKLGIGGTNAILGFYAEKDNGSGYVGGFRSTNSSPYLTIQTTGGVTNLQGINSGFTDVAAIGLQPSGGNINVGAGNFVMTSGYGIDFSATSGTGTSELFDDYEEGTFTPNVSDGTSNATFAGLGGRYTKIGRIVHVEIYFININTSGLTSGNTMRIGGLPFTHVTSTFNNAILNTQAHTLASTNGAVSAALGSNLTYMILIDGTSTSISSALTVAAVTSGTTDLYISGTYEAA
jgi:hypothetical protein